MYFLRLGVEFSLWIPVDITLRFPYLENSFNPLKVAIVVKSCVLQSIPNNTLGSEKNHNSKNSVNIISWVLGEK